MKSCLILASVASMIEQFNMPNIELLQSMGYHVDVACNFEEGNTCSDEVIQKLKRRLEETDVQFYQINFARNITSINRNIKAIQKVINLVKKNQYTFLHCHSPIGGVAGRIAGKITSTKVIYTAHGFHFYDGAPLINWMLYYPVEKFLSRWTDLLITINKEDYQRAKNHFQMKKVEYIPGVGVDIERFSAHTVTKSEKRHELGLPLNAFVLLSVGELADRKNHQVVINALGEMRDADIYYVIAGAGELHERYRKLSEQYGIEKQIMLLGPRTDVDELCDMADVFVHPSVREGLGIAPLEGMAAGLPLISSYINGIKDYTQDDVTGCCIDDPKDVEKMKVAIRKMKNDTHFREMCSANNIKIAKRFGLKNSEKIMEKIYKSGGV